MRRTICLILFVLSASPAPARTLLKPQGQNALALRTKSITADATIDRQFATTEMTLVFANTTQDRMEADFICTLPNQSLVTYFAYWYGDEKVVARIVEKERAAAIYRHITSRMRDPALIELVGKNTFRARIFPVMPNSDLKVEMKMVQVLPSDEWGAFYEFPLREESEEQPPALDSLRIDVTVKPDPAALRVTNNYGLDVAKEDGGYRFTLSGTNYSPPKDLRVNIVRKKQPLHAALYAARSGGADGFFALALTPQNSLARPRVRISGAGVYEVVPSTLAAVKAHQTLAVFGRYKGSGAARVALTGNSPAGAKVFNASVAFPDAREPNNLATKFWAAGRIDQLSQGNRAERNRSEITRLSLRFTLPSRFTSWLAVPQEEMKIYWRDKLWAEMHAVARQLAEEQFSKNPRSWRVAELRRELRSLAAQTGANPEEMESRWRLEMLARRIRPLARELLRERSRSKPRAWRVAQLQKDLKRLARKMGLDSQWALREAETRELCLELGETSGAYYREIRRVGPDPKRIKLLEAKISWLRTRIGDPLITVDAPADAQQVVALFPDGEAKPLAYNPETRRWEGRFDIPAYAREGDYIVTIIIVLKDGTRRQIVLHYAVDLTRPSGQVRAALVTEPQNTLRLDVAASGDTSRVVAILPWGLRIPLASADSPQQFFGLVEVPREFREKPFMVHLILTDKAHNRLSLSVDISAQ